MAREKDDSGGLGVGNLGVSVKGRQDLAATGVLAREQADLVGWVATTRRGVEGVHQSYGVIHGIGQISADTDNEGVALMIGFYIRDANGNVDFQFSVAAGEIHTARVR